MGKAKKVNRASFSLEDEYIEKMKEIITLTRRSQTEELRCMIDNTAEALGIEPVRKPVPTEA
jgi:hypothetical protein